jgi:uncharacterized protein (TIGR03032 family)
MSATSQTFITRPIFVVAPPRSGAAAVVSALARAPGVVLSGGDNGSVLDDLPELHPSQRSWDSNRLTVADAKPEVVARVHETIHPGDVNGDEPAVTATPERAAEPNDQENGAEPQQEQAVRPLDGTPKNALRIPFLSAVFPDATFVYVYRDPRESLAEIVTDWERGAVVTYPELPDWPGPPWSYLLVPGWRGLSGKPLPEIVAEQWATTTRTLLDDLENLAPERWCVTDRTALLEDPKREIDRLCGFLGVEPSEELSAPLRAAREQLAEQAGQAAGAGAEAVAEVLPRTDDIARRAREWLATPPGSGRRKPTSADSPLRSVYTGSLPPLLEQMRSSLLVSTYQTGKLICARYDQGRVNTHFRNFDKPMGLAVHAGRFALGTRTEVWDFRNMAEAAPKIEPKDKHDACFLPRNRHYTGDIAIHEIAFAQGELWVCATNFSCLGTLDAHHSFVPRWKPPFITELVPEDRCHLNGLAVIDDEVRYVTALGETNERGGWRENKAGGGILIDAESGETVLGGLSMPHSPRWHQDRLWLLESGKGGFCVADLDTGEVETVTELPGFTRGMVMAGPLAFIGLSQVRETATFGGLPLTERLDERLCGVWVVNVESGSIVGFLRFEELVQEIFDVTILAGTRYPEIAEAGSEAVSYSFALPDTARS